MARILVVDDENSIRTTLGIFLEQTGYEVVTAEDVSIALQRLEDGTVDVVVSDIAMPRVSGVQLLQMIRQGSPRVQVIMMTGQPTVETAAAAVRAGAFDYLIKPVAKDDFLRCVDKAAKFKASEDERIRLAEAERRHKAELEQNYNRLRDLESLRDSLVHMIVHDLRSPLAGIHGYLDLLKARMAAGFGPTESGYFSHIERNTDRMVQMVTAVLDVNRLESGLMPLKLQAYDLTELARTALASLVSLAGERQVSVEAPSEPVMAKADKEIISRVIGNLLSNAFKFTPDCGAMRVMVSRQDSVARLAVADTGPGIPDKHHQRIFEKFGTIDKSTRGYSTGLGLAFCKLAIEAHGGRIGVDSAVGKGSTFWFEMPAV
jgi:two-component system, sensor histidine kinase and response regulator